MTVASDDDGRVARKRGVDELVVVVILGTYPAPRAGT